MPYMLGITENDRGTCRVTLPTERPHIVAKDKSKKSAGADDFAKPSEAPSGGDGWNLTDDDNRGALLLITPLRIEKVATKFSDELKEVIVCDIVKLNEKKPEKSEEHEEVYVFSGYVKGALRGYIGERRVLGRLQNTEDTSKKKDRGNHYWELEDAKPKDIETARAYMEAANDPLKGGMDDGKKSKGKKDKPADEPKAKGKGKKDEPVKKDKKKGKG